MSRGDAVEALGGYLAGPRVKREFRFFTYLLGKKKAKVRLTERLRMDGYDCG